MKSIVWSGAVAIEVFRAEVVYLITNSKGYLYDEIENILKDDLGMKDAAAISFSKEIRKCLDEEDDVLPPGLTLDIPCSLGGRDIFVIFEGTPKTLKDGVIIHELYHATRHICRNRGVDDEETEAYMQEYLYEKFKEHIACLGKAKKEKEEKKE